MASVISENSMGQSCMSLIRTIALKDSRSIKRNFRTKTKL